MTSIKDIDFKIYQCKSKVNNVLITIHGFAGDKDSSVIDAVAKEMTKYNYEVLAFDLPCHGKDKNNDVLKLDNCKNYLAIIENYVVDNYKNVPISYFATSFGGYLLLNHLSKSTLTYNKIILRAPAVYMPEILTDIILPEHNLSVEDLKSGNKNLGYARELLVDFNFYRDLIKNKEFDFVSDNYLYILQGKRDEVVDYKKNEKFFQKYFLNKHKFFYFDKADHRFKNDGELEKIVEITKNILI